MEIFFNLFKIKYVKMMDLLRNDPNINISSRDTVNVFINLESIFTKMCIGSVNEYIKTAGKNAQIEFIANVINLAAHYKWFFTKNKLKTNVYLLFPSFMANEYKNREFNKEYRMYYQHKFVDNSDNELFAKVITDSIPFIQLILEYVEGVYFIDSDNIENSVVPYIISSQQTNEKHHNFIVTTSTYDFQYVNYDDFAILVPKQDESELVHRHNVMEFIYKTYKVNTVNLVPSEFMPFILSIVGNKSRNIYNVRGMAMKNTIRVIDAALKAGIVSSRTTNINLLIEIIKPAWRETILSNYYCTDIKFQHSLLSYTDIHNINSQLTDKFDNVALKRINDKYFKMFPLMLMEITASASGKSNLKF